MSRLAKLAYGLIAAVATGALAKGITTWGDLDSKVVELLQIVATPKNISIIAWSMSGAAGLIATVLWIVLRIDERLYDLIQPWPMFGSLAPTPNSFVARLEHHRGANRTDAELSVELVNENGFPVRFHARLEGNINGKVASPIEIEGYVNANKSTSLILRTQDVPTRPTQSGEPSVSGALRYEVTYFKAPDRKRKRRTAKRAEFRTFIPIRTETPLEQQIPIKRAEEMRWSFSQEQEE